MSFKLPKIKGNALYSPSIMIFAIIIGYQIANSDFVEKNYSFAYLLVGAGVVLFLKVFTLTFASLEKALWDKKAFLAGAFLILAITQFWFGFLGIDHLTRSTFPDITIQWFLLSNVLFAIEIFLSKTIKSIRLNLFIIVIYAVILFGLTFKWFSGDIQGFITFQQSIGYFSIISELTMFFTVLNFFVDKSKTSEVSVDSKSKTTTPKQPLDSDNQESEKFSTNKVLPLDNK